MFRLRHLQGARAGLVETVSRLPLTLGRDAGCDLSFSAESERAVSTRHAEIREEAGAIVLFDLGSTNGTFVNGERVFKHTLGEGDLIGLGGEEGPRIRFEPLPRAALDGQVRDAAAQAVFRLRKKDREEGVGQTMAIVLDELHALVSRQETGWRRRALGFGLLMICLLGALGLLWSADRSRYVARLEEARSLDAGLRALEEEIEASRADDPMLPEKIQRLAALATRATALGAKQRSGLDADLHHLLTEFEATTHPLPRLFVERVGFYLEEWTERRPLGRIWEKHQAHWPLIRDLFEQEGVPETLAYLVWQESHFEAESCSRAGARGLWQFMPATGRRYGLRISAECAQARPAPGRLRCPCEGVDERLDLERSTRAAARYLGDLLAEFGMDAFMLALASYNKGEGGLRKILREQKLRRREERDFWNLYYLKLLPEETLEYVPSVLAAALVGRDPARYGLSLHTPPDIAPDSTPTATAPAAQSQGGW